MANQFLQQLDDETKDRLQAAVTQALSEGIPEQTITALIEKNAEHIFRESFRQKAKSFSDPIDSAIGMGLSLIEPNIENLIALPLSFLTGPGVGKLAAKGLANRGIRRVAVKFLADPFSHRRTVVFNAARKEGLLEAFGSAVRMKDEPGFLLSLSRAFGFALPFAATDAADAMMDDESPAGAFGGTLGAFVALDMVLTSALPGVGHKISSSLRRRFTEEVFRKSPTGEAIMGAEKLLRGGSAAHLFTSTGDLLRGAARRADPALVNLGRQIADEIPDSIMTRIKDRIAAPYRLKRQFTERFTAEGVDPREVRPVRPNVRIDTSEIETTPEVEAELREFVDARLAERGIVLPPPERSKVVEAVSFEAAMRVPGRAADIGHDGLVTIGEATSRAMTSIRSESPKAAAAIDEATELAETAGLIGNSPAEQTVTTAIKNTRSVPIDARVPGAVTKDPVVAQTSAGPVPRAPDIVTELDASGQLVTAAPTTRRPRLPETLSRGNRIQRNSDGRTGVVENIARSGIKSPKIFKVGVMWDDGGFQLVRPTEISLAETPIHALEAEAEAAATAAAEVPLKRTGRAYVNSLGPAAKGSAVRVSRPDGSTVDAVITEAGENSVTIRLPSGRKQTVPYKNVLGGVVDTPPPVVPTIPTPRAPDLVMTDAEGLEADIAARIFPFRSGRNFGLRINWADLSRMTPETKARFPKESLLGRQAVVTKAHVVAPVGSTARTKGIPMPAGTELIIGREEFGFVKGHRKLDYRAYVWRLDPDSQAFHVVHYGNVEHLKAAGVEIADTPFGGTPEASRNALLEIIAREKVTAADVERVESKVFQSIITGKETRIPREEISRVLNDMPDGIPFYNSMIVQRLKARNIRRTTSMAAAPEIRGAERMAREVADPLHLRRRSEGEMFPKVENIEILKTFRSEEPDPEKLAILQNEMENFRRLSFIEEGMTPRKEVAARKLKGKKAAGIHLTEKERVLDSLIISARRGLTEPEATQLAELKSRFSTVQNLEAEAQASTNEMVGAITAYRPIPLGEGGVPIVTTPEILPVSAPGPQLPMASQVASKLAVDDASIVADPVTADTLRNRFKKIASDEESALDLMFGLNDFANARGLKIDVHWNPDYTGDAAKEKLVAAVDVTFEGRTVRSYSAEQIPELIDDLANFTPGDSTFAEKMRLIMGDLNDFRPDGGC